MRAELQFLVVDNVSNMRRLVSGLLKELGYAKICEAEDGEQALRLLRSSHEPALRIDFVITDSEMPLMDGLELLKAIRQDANLCHLPVLMVTVDAKKANIIAAAQAGADGYIVELSIATVREKVDAILVKRKLSI